MYLNRWFIVHNLINIINIYLIRFVEIIQLGWFDWKRSNFSFFYLRFVKDFFSTIFFFKSLSIYIFWHFSREIALFLENIPKCVISRDDDKTILLSMLIFDFTITLLIWSLSSNEERSWNVDIMGLLASIIKWWE